MNHNITKIKALHFEHQIDLMWCNGNYEPMEKLLEMIDIPYNRDDLMDFGWLLSDSFIDNWGIDETIKRMKSFIPLDKENLNTDSSEGQTCLNKECTFWHSDREPSCYTMYSDCWADIHLYVCMAIKIGGLSALKELRDKWNIDTEVLYQYYDADQKGLYEKELYEMNLPIKDVIKKHLHQIKIKGDDKMYFMEELSKINQKDDLSVFWTENQMYVNDESDGQATETCSLFESYKFALLINAPTFDYVASDEEIKTFHRELLELYDDCFSDDEKDKYLIDVWEYLDDIADDYKKLTGVTINDIDTKRAIVSYMSETDWENNCAMGFGSGTYIARILSDHIIGDDRHKVKRCNNPLAIELAEKYLQTDDYTLKGFAKALKKANQYEMNTPKNFNEFLIQSHRISEKCYYLLNRLMQDNREFEEDILVGYIDWFGDYDMNERYIYCHINSIDNEIYFHENRENAPKSAYLHDIAFPHLVSDQDRLQKDIEIKLTEQIIDEMVEDAINDIYGWIITSKENVYFGEEWAYVYCHMYGTVGKYA